MGLYFTGEGCTGSGGVKGLVRGESLLGGVLDSFNQGPRKQKDDHYVYEEAHHSSVWYPGSCPLSYPVHGTDEPLKEEESGYTQNASKSSHLAFAYSVRI